MANPHRGGVSLKAGDATYTLSLSVNAQCELEDALDMPVSQIAGVLQAGADMRTLRTIIWGALRDHHKDVDLAGAGVVATEAGLTQTLVAIGEAFRLAFPDAEEGKSAARPPQAKGRSRSTS